MVELVMKELGWNARSLGSNLPLELLDPAVQDLRPQICWVSVSFVDAPERLRQQLESLSEKGQADGFRILCGGQALDEDLREGLSDVTFVDRLRDLETIARTTG
ncbi:MAG: hypothetical protein ACR2NZ_23810 [Rubripirellula sp.]